MGKPRRTVKGAVQSAGSGGGTRKPAGMTAPKGEAGGSGLKTEQHGTFPKYTAEPTNPEEIYDDVYEEEPRWTEKDLKAHREKQRPVFFRRSFKQNNRQPSRQRTYIDDNFEHMYGDLDYPTAKQKKPGFFARIKKRFTKRESPAPHQSLPTKDDLTTPTQEADDLKTKSDEWKSFPPPLRKFVQEPDNLGVRRDSHRANAATQTVDSFAEYFFEHYDDPDAFEKCYDEIFNPYSDEVLPVVPQPGKVKQTSQQDSKGVASQNVQVSEHTIIHRAQVETRPQPEDQHERYSTLGNILDRRDTSDGRSTFDRPNADKNEGPDEEDDHEDVFEPFTTLYLGDKGPLRTGASRTNIDPTVAAAHSGHDDFSTNEPSEVADDMKPLLRAPPADEEIRAPPTSSNLGHRADEPKDYTIPSSSAANASVVETGSAGATDKTPDAERQEEANRVEDTQDTDTEQPSPLPPVPGIEQPPPLPPTSDPGIEQPPPLPPVPGIEQPPPLPPTSDPGIEQPPPLPPRRKPPSHAKPMFRARRPKPGQAPDKPLPPSPTDLPTRSGLPIGHSSSLPPPPLKPPPTQQAPDKSLPPSPTEFPTNPGLPTISHRSLPAPASRVTRVYPPPLGGRTPRPPTKAPSLPRHAAPRLKGTLHPSWAPPAPTSGKDSSSPSSVGQPSQFHELRDFWQQSSAVQTGLSCHEAQASSAQKVEVTPVPGVGQPPPVPPRLFSRARPRHSIPQPDDRKDKQKPMESTLPTLKALASGMFVALREMLSFLLCFYEMEADPVEG